MVSARLCVWCHENDVSVSGVTSQMSSGLDEAASVKISLIDAAIRVIAQSRQNNRQKFRQQLVQQV